MGMGASGSTHWERARSRRASAARTNADRAAVALAAGCLLGSACLSCGATPGDARSLGDDLGTFGVQADQLRNACGENALGSTERWTFDVELTRADTELFWDGRIGGTVAASGAFEISALVSVTLRSPRGPDTGCRIARDDSISGTLVSDGAGSVSAFSGEMSFEFSAEPDSTCTLDEQDAAGLPELPCGMSYALQAVRTRAPTP
jgi:hypothetical protein